MDSTWWTRAFRGIFAGASDARRQMMAGWGDTSLKISPDEFPDPEVDVAASESSHEQMVVLAGGCFWCIEAVYAEVDGIVSMTSGYAGGTAQTADYDTVCSGRTDHAEAVQIRFDPSRISFGQVLKLFFSVAHDPTQMNRQGADVGRQYRSEIFYTDAEQKRVAEAYVEQLNRAGVFNGPIVTRISPLETFYDGEAYHQGYAASHPNQPYIAAVAMPKVQKLRKYFSGRLKSGSPRG
jgi:peptide-methionine (S)-S-oxide reductase